MSYLKNFCSLATQHASIICVCMNECPTRKHQGTLSSLTPRQVSSPNTRRRQQWLEDIVGGPGLIFAKYRHKAKHRCAHLCRYIVQKKTKNNSQKAKKRLNLKYAHTHTTTTTTTTHTHTHTHTGKRGFGDADGARGCVPV